MLWHKLLIFFFWLLPFSFALNPSPGIDLSATRVFSLIVVIFWFLASLKNKKLLIDNRPRFWFFLLFLFIAGLSYTWAIDPSRSIKKYLFIFPFFLLYFPVYTASMNTDLRLRLIKTLFYSTLLSSLIGFSQFFMQFILGLNPTINILSKTLIPFFQGNSFAKLIIQYPSWLVNIAGKNFLRAFGTFPDPHLFSLFLNMVIPLGLYLYVKEKKLFYLAFTAFLSLVSLLSFSRAAYLSLAAGSLFLLLNSAVINYFKKKPLPLLLLSLGIILLLAIPNPFSQRFFASFNLKEGSNSGRLQMWGKATEITLDYPLTGIGLGNFSRYVAPTLAERNPVYAHNLFLDFASETGLIATFALSLSLVFPILGYFKRPSLFKKYLAASFVILIVHSMFETPFYSVHVFPLTITLLALKTSSVNS